MALQLGHLYQALIGAGAEQESAQRAAEEVANYDNRLSGLEGDMKVVKWMLGTIIALCLILVGIGLTTLSRIVLP